MVGITFVDLGREVEENQMEIAIPVREVVSLKRSLPYALAWWEVSYRVNKVSN